MMTTKLYTPQVAIKFNTEKLLEEIHSLIGDRKVKECYISDDGDLLVVSFWWEDNSGRATWMDFKLADYIEVGIVEFKESK